ncbi:MAG: DEAD/DEAH box helicase family protein, partial [Bacteroidota bacterium]
MKDMIWRPYQKKAKKLIKENYDKGVKEQLIVQATGTGKRIQRIDLMNHFKRSLFIAHREELINQAFEDI